MIGGEYTLPWRDSTPPKAYEKGMLPNKRIEPSARLHSADSTGTNVKQDPGGILSKKNPDHVVHPRQRSSASSTWILSADAAGAQETERQSFGRGGVGVSCRWA